MDIFYPVFSLVMLTFIVALSIGISRLYSVKKKHVDPRFYKLFTGYEAADYERKFSRNFSNLFEMPVLFYTLALLSIATQISHPMMISLAWGYVALRFAHTLIHISYNRTIHRLFLFFISNLVLVSMWLIYLVEFINSDSML